MLALLLAGVVASAPAAEPPPLDRFPRAAASYLVQRDGRVLWERAASAPRPPASLAKIMTALVVLEEGWDAEAPVRIGARAAAETGSRLGMKAGETMAAGDLLTAMLVSSANDAAVALAEHRAGSVEAFVKRMNTRAKEMMLGQTHFLNPTGWDAPGQTSSARDLAAMAEAALGLPEFARRVAVREATVATTGGRRFAVRTSNHLLAHCEGARGVKTGFTAKAGKCVVALVEREGHRVLLVLLDSEDRWWTAAALIEAAFDEARPPR